MSTIAKRSPIPFGKYLLLDRVNIGGMAEVWRAKTFGAGGFERLVAIKRILPNIAEDAEFIAMFIDEAKISVQLNHANIAQIYELSHIGNSYFIAMEYVSGKDLRAVFERCRKRGEPAPVALTCYAIAQCCEGLDYAHRAKDKAGADMHIVHRDVSPQNILVSFDGEVKVIDFGIAKAAGKATKTQAGILKGKFGYMSPEQIRGLPLDRRSDIFAIGICLYELLTGERLFVGDTDFSVLEKVRKVEVLPPSHFNRRVAPELERIVMKALAKDVEERYQCAGDVAEELRAFMYSTGNAFARKDLSAFMCATFAEDLEKERARLHDYSEVKAPEETPSVGGAGDDGVPPAASPLLVRQSAGAALASGVVPPSAGAGADGGPSMARSAAPLGGSTAPRLPSSNETSAPVALPRLTAAAPSDGADAPTHQATIIESARARAMRPGLQAGEASSSPALPSGPVAAGEVAGRKAREAGRVPPKRVARPGGSRRASSEVGLEAAGAARGSGALPEVSNARLIIALAGIVALLSLGVVAAVLLRPPATGLVILTVPEGVKGSVEVQINGERISEHDGAPLRDWPQVRTVKVGKAVVRLSAPGYEPVLEIVEVKEDEPVEVNGVLKPQKRTP